MMGNPQPSLGLAVSANRRSLTHPQHSPCSQKGVPAKPLGVSPEALTIVLFIQSPCSQSWRVPRNFHRTLPPWEWILAARPSRIASSARVELRQDCSHHEVRVSIYAFYDGREVKPGNTDLETGLFVLFSHLAYQVLCRDESRSAFFQ